MRRHVTTLAALVVLLTACGGTDAEDGDVDTTAPSPADTAAPGDTADASVPDEGVLVGILAPFSGEMGSFGEYVADGYTTAAEEINASGLLECGPINFVTADDETSPEVGRREAERMIGQGVVGVVGMTSDILIAIAPLAQEAEVVVGSPYAGSTAVTDLGGNFVYRTVGADIEDGVAAATWIVDEGYEDVAVVTQQEEAQQSAGTAARNALAELDVTVVADQEYAPGEASYSGVLATILGAEPGIIYLAGGQESSLTIINEAIQLGYEGDWLFSADLATDEVIQAAGAASLEGVAHTVISSTDQTTDEYLHFAEMHEATTGVEPGPFGANSYDNLNLMALAMVASGDCSGVGINSAMVEVSREGTPVTTFEEGATLLAAGEDIDYQGASGPVDFDETGSVINSYSVQQVQDGVWAEVTFYPATEIADVAP